VEKNLGISSVPEYNEALRQFGVTKVINKDYRFLDQFSDTVVASMKEFLSDNHFK
jgi:hypothetical protein